MTYMSRLSKAEMLGQKTFGRLFIVIFILVKMTCVNGQFKVTGFSDAEAGTKRTVTCEYPGAAVYTWSPPNGPPTTGSKVTFTVDVKLHEGVWRCTAYYNGTRLSTITRYLLVYCPESEIASSASNTNPEIGEKVELFCQVKYPDHSLIQWDHRSLYPVSDRAIAAVYRTCNVYREKDNINWAPGTVCKVSKVAQNFTLVINKVQDSIAGYWKCRDYGKRRCSSKPLKITVPKPPRDPPILTGFDSEPIVGTNHTLTCNAWQPHARAMTYTWYKDGQQVSSGNTSTLSLSPVDRRAAGKYRCKVVDTMNYKVMADAVLRVACTDSHIIASASNTNPEIGEKVELFCQVRYPNPVLVQWDLRGRYSNSYTAIAYVRTTCEVYRDSSNIKWAPGTVCDVSKNQNFSLVINEMREANAGYWKCQDFGRRRCSSKPLKITVPKPPRNPPILTGFDGYPIIGNNHNLTCNAWRPLARAMTYTWYKDGQQISSGNTSTLFLSPVDRYTTGKYRCIVVDKRNNTVQAEDALIVSSDGLLCLATWELYVIGALCGFLLLVLLALVIFLMVRKTSASEVQYKKEAMDSDGYLVPKGSDDMVPQKGGQEELNNQYESMSNVGVSNNTYSATEDNVPNVYQTLQ